MPSLSQLVKRILSNGRVAARFADRAEKYNYYALFMGLGWVLAGALGAFSMLYMPNTAAQIPGSGAAVALFASVVTVPMGAMVAANRWRKRQVNFGVSVRFVREQAVVKAAFDDRLATIETLKLPPQTLEQLRVKAYEEYLTKLGEVERRDGLDSMIPDALDQTFHQIRRAEVQLRMIESRESWDDNHEDHRCRRFVLRESDYERIRRACSEEWLKLGRVYRGEPLISRSGSSYIQVFDDEESSRSVLLSADLLDEL